MIACQQKIAIHRAVIKLHSASHRDKTSPNLICVPQRDFNGSPRHGCDSSLKPNIAGFGLYLSVSSSSSRTHSPTEHEQQNTVHFRVSGQTLQIKSPQKRLLDSSMDFSLNQQNYLNILVIFLSLLVIFCNNPALRQIINKYKHK